MCVGEEDFSGDKRTGEEEEEEAAEVELRQTNFSWRRRSRGSVSAPR